MIDPITQGMTFHTHYDEDRSITTRYWKRADQPIYEDHPDKDMLPCNELYFMHHADLPSIELESYDRNADNYFWYKIWFWNNAFHRENDIGYESSNSKSWIRNGKVHRYDGWASTGVLGQEYWSINGKIIENPQDYFDWLKEMDMDINNLSDKDKVIIDLKWG